MQNGNQNRGGILPEDRTSAEGHCPITYPAVNMEPA
jgi:hypothetical protein